MTTLIWKGLIFITNASLIKGRGYQHWTATLSYNGKAILGFFKSSILVLILIPKMISKYNLCTNLTLVILSFNNKPSSLSVFNPLTHWVSIYCDMPMMTNAHELMMSHVIFLHLVLKKIVSMGSRTITFFSFFHISTIQISNWNCLIQGWIHTFTNIVIFYPTHRYLLLALPCKAGILCWESL
jgi:hypothetical protein